MDYIIRRANINDSSYINKLLTKLIRDEKRYDININEKCEVKRFYENLIENDNNLILVVEFDNKIIGYLYGLIEYRGDAYIERVARIDALYIESDYRNTGIGSNLLKNFKQWVIDKNIKYIEICAQVENKNAVNLYEKMGFKNFKSIMNIEL